MPAFRPTPPPFPPPSNPLAGLSAKAMPRPASSSSALEGRGAYAVEAAKVEVKSEPGDFELESETEEAPSEEGEELDAMELDIVSDLAPWAAGGKGKGKKGKGSPGGRVEMTEDGGHVFNMIKKDR